MATTQPTEPAHSTSAAEFDLWPHQVRMLDSFHQAVDQGARRIVEVAPPGAGKSRVIAELAKEFASQGVVIYTHRKMLTDQTSGVLEDMEIEHGLRASSHKPALAHGVQVSSMPTEHSRVYRRKKWDLHDCKLVVIDEPHVQKGDVAQRIIRDHMRAGAIVVGFTATPVDMGQVVEVDRDDGGKDKFRLYQRLCIGANYSELKACGAHVPCETFSPTDVDMKEMDAVRQRVRAIVRGKGGDYSAEKIAKAMPPQVIFGHVFDHYQQLNQQQWPAILFAPGVAESKWFAQQFTKLGVPAAHVDGGRIWVDGDEIETSSEARADILSRHRSGDIKLICNRFVLREAIDIPWAYHGIEATVYGALSSFLQSSGRLLRRDPTRPEMEKVIWQSHGGSAWRHGFLDEDRTWTLTTTNQSAAKQRKKKLEDGDLSEGIVCPKCSGMRLSGPECPHCGHKHVRSVRHVVQVDGTLKRIVGYMVKRRHRRESSSQQKAWDQCFYRAKHSTMTFAQAAALYYKENGHSPPYHLDKVPPQNSGYWQWRVADVDWTDVVGWRKEKQKHELKGGTHGQEIC